MDTTEIRHGNSDVKHGNTRDRRVEVARDIIDALIGAVEYDDDGPDEYKVLGDILTRAGFAWRCIDSECMGINHLNASNCDNCNKRRPKARDIPEPEDMTRLSVDYHRRLEMKKNADKAQKENEV